MRAEARLPAAFGAASVLAQISYPLLHGGARDVVIAVVVTTFAAASLTAAANSRGPVACLALAGAGLLAFAVEVAGLHTGLPFGRYAYTGALGVRLLGVPGVVGLAWLMFAWPSAVVAARIARAYPARVVAGAWSLTAWDLYLDPQLVAAGGWRWRHPAPHLPGVPTVPLTNYGGWLLVSLAVSALLQLVVRAPRPGDGVPLALFAWTWLGSALALAAFLGLPWAALWGFLALGAVAVPWVAAGVRR